MDVLFSPPDITEREITEVVDTLRSGWITTGPKTKLFEKNIAEFCHTSKAVCLNSATACSEMALRALGIGPGDEVITSAYTYTASASVVCHVGAKLVLVDTAENSHEMDYEKLEAAITEKTKAIIPVHLYGQCADMDVICSIAQKYKLKVIEDAAQAAGAEYKGKKAGSMGDAGCISFFPTKNLGAAGDGGMIITSDEAIYKQCMALRVHGSGMNGYFTYGLQKGTDISQPEVDFNGNLPKYFNFVVGYNSRLDALQASILNVKLDYLDGWNERRRQIAAMYNEKITNQLVKKPFIAEYNTHIYYVYLLVTEKRDKLRKYLEDCGISSGVYFPVPLHLQKVFENLKYKKGDFPNAENIAENSLVIPMFPELTDEEIQSVIKTVNSYKG